MVRRNAGPSQADLIDFLTDPKAVADRFGSSPAALFGAYARRAAETDPGIAAQLRDDLGSPAGMLPRPGSAWRALNVAGAAGAALNGKAGYGSWGEFARRVGNAELRNAWTETVPSEGGFLTSETLRSDLLRWSLESAVMRPGALVIPVTDTELRTGLPVVDDISHELDPSQVLGGVTWAWVAEGAEIAASAPTFGRSVMEARKIAGLLGPIPNELLADGGGALDVFFGQVVPKGYAWAEDAEFINGDGVGVPQGYLSAPAALTVSRAASGHIGFADVVGLVAAMLPQSLRSAVFIASHTALTDMLSVYESIGTPADAAVPPSMWVQSTPSGGWTLLGRPLLVTEKAPALGTRGDLTLIDRSFYVIADRVAFTLAESAKGPGFQSDETYYRMTARLDARVWLSHPVTSAAGTQVSPVAVLGDAA